jgi:preprotein translocase subunit YajC
MKNSVKKILSFVMIMAIAMLSLSMVAFATDAAATGAPAASSPAAATNGAQAQQPKGMNPWIMIVIYILFFVVVGYFLIYRPNKKRKKQEEELKNSIMLGDEVTTIGGIVGKVVNIKDDNITVETSIDKTLMEFKNWAIRDVKKLITDDEPESK